MKSLIALLLPNMVFWAVLIGVFFHRVRDRTTPYRRSLDAVVIVLFLISLPIGPKLLGDVWRVSSFEHPSPASPDARGVFVFGGGMGADGYGRYWPSAASIRRLAVGAGLASEHELPLVFSGGPSLNEGPSEAEVMADFLPIFLEEEELSPPPEVHEDKSSLNSWQNAKAAKEIMTRENWDGILAVTDPLHARRALACLRQVGVPVLGLRTPHSETRIGPLDFLPSINGLAAWKGVGYEIAASAYYVVSGRTSVSDYFLHNL